jgi:hypothetical protein
VSKIDLRTIIFENRLVNKKSGKTISLNDEKSRIEIINNYNNFITSNLTIMIYSLINITLIYFLLFFGERSLSEFVSIEIHIEQSGYFIKIYSVSIAAFMQISNLINSIAVNGVLDKYQKILWA